MKTTPRMRRSVAHATSAPASYSVDAAEAQHEVIARCARALVLVALGALRWSVIRGTTMIGRRAPQGPRWNRGRRSPSQAVQTRLPV